MMTIVVHPRHGGWCDICGGTGSPNIEHVDVEPAKFTRENHPYHFNYPRDGGPVACDCSIGRHHDADEHPVSDARANHPSRTGSPQASLHNLVTEFLTVEEVSKILRISKMTVYRLVNEGTLQGFRIGRSIRIRRESVDAYLILCMIVPGQLSVDELANEDED